MLEYLVTSKARRRLLQLLWADDVKAPVLRLAELGGLNYRSAHSELNQMLRAGLANCLREGNATVFEANSKHPQAGLLRSLVTANAARSPEGKDSQHEVEAERTRAWLSRRGAPLHANPVEAEPPSLEILVVQGAKLARCDASVARSMPVFVWLNRQDLDFRSLRREAHNQGEKRTVGFLLALTGALARDSSLSGVAEDYRDKRVKRTEDFFVRRQSTVERRLAEARTPAVARDWHFRMNMTLESFASTFTKFVSDATV